MSLKKISFYVILIFTTVNLSFSTTIDSLLNDVKIESNSDSVARIYNQISLLYKSTNLDSAILYARKALSLIEQNKNEFRLDLLCRIGDLNYRKGDYNEALSCFIKADSILLALNIPNKKAEVATFVGIINEIKGNYDVAFEKYLQSLKIYKSQNDTIAEYFINQKLIKTKYMLVLKVVLPF